MSNDKKTIYKVVVNQNSAYLVLGNNVKSATKKTLEFLVKFDDLELDTDDFDLEVSEYDQEIPTEENPVVEFSDY